MWWALFETIYISLLSLVFSFIFAIVFGIITCETDKEGLYPNKVINVIMNRTIDIGRSIPFILLIVFLFPVTRALIGTAIGNKAAIFSLSICAVPFESRLIERTMKSVDKGIVEAAMSLGANKIQTIWKVKLPSKISALVNDASISLINIIGYSSMVGTIGGGGLGNYAIVYGFQRFDWLIILYSVLLIVGLVVIIQILNNVVVKFLKRRRL